MWETYYPLFPDDIEGLGLTEDQLSGFTWNAEEGCWEITPMTDVGPDGAPNGLPDVLDALITGSDFYDQVSGNQIYH